MKIGILTFHHTANYGAVLQSFALSTFIRSLGHDVEIIDYRPREAEEFYWNNMRFLKLFPPYRTPKFGLIDFDALERYIKFWKFQIFFKRYFRIIMKFMEYSKKGNLFIYCKAYFLKF